MDTATLSAACDAAVRNRALDAREARALLELLPGTWVYEGEAVSVEGVREPVSGLETIRCVQRDWLLMEAVPHAPGRSMPTTLTALCFDDGHARYVGSRFDSDSPIVWSIRGRFHAGIVALTLETDAAMCREVIEFTGPDRRRVTLYEGAGDGWRRRRIMEYHRTKW